MAIKATGNISWASVFRQFQGKTGLFLNSKYDLPSVTNPRLAGGMHWTAVDYMEFLEALYDKRILTPDLIKKLSSDQISGVRIVNSPAITRLGEDWHYGYGAWIECETNPYDCIKTERISSPGAYGAYPFIDYTHGYYGIIARQGELGAYNEGVEIFRTVSGKVEAWAALN
jgi:CubicO group peptidase (beta-lactamase class C family)